MNLIRARHVPLRTCVACGVKIAQRGMLRVVRTAEGEAEVDLTGKSAGRGAYICRDNEHIGLRGLAVRIRRALRLESDVSDEFLAMLGEVLARSDQGTVSSRRGIEE